LLTDELVIRVA